uniref:TNFR-Cys domain-containing protein n=1 Tax=Arion vulgaris TaxID=1028688 RepID=A0A0B7A394_9EUPU
MGSVKCWILQGTMCLFLFCFLQVVSKPANFTDNSCTACDDGNCTKEVNCPQRCDRKCPTSYFKFKLFQNSDRCGNSTTKGMIDEGIRGEAATSANPDGTGATNPSTPAPTTTTAVEVWLCHYCSLPDCIQCQDEEDSPKCENCTVGFHLNNINHTCVQDEVEELTGAVVAGIVIAVLCLVGIVVCGVIFLFGKYRHRRRGGGDIHRMKSKVGGRDGSGAPQGPKISVEEVKNKRNDVFCYKNDTTMEREQLTNGMCGLSLINEHEEINKLDPAPGPPGSVPNPYSDTHCGYDRPSANNPRDSHSYSPWQAGRNEEPYLNNQIDKQDSTENIYFNTQQASSSGTSSRNQSKGSKISEAVKKYQHQIQTQESNDFYEPVASRPAIVDNREIYGNCESVTLVENDAGYGEDIYLNENQELYENT